jgi:hypothetical protein
MNSAGDRTVRLRNCNEGEVPHLTIAGRNREVLFNNNGSIQGVSRLRYEPSGAISFVGDLQIDGNILITGDIVPQVASRAVPTSSFGNPNNPFKNIYLSNTIKLGDTYISSEAGTLYINVNGGQKTALLTSAEPESKNSTDTWVQTHLLNPPAQLPSVSAISRSTDIFITWPYPSQIQAGFMPGWLPTLSGFNATVSAAAVKLTVAANQGGGFLNAHDGSSFADCLILSRIPGRSGFEQRSLPDGSSHYAYVYRDAALSSIADNNSQLTLWYNNYNPKSNPLTVKFNAFQPSGSPSAPIALNTSSIMQSSMTFQWAAPFSVDSTDPYSSATIQNYSVTYSSTPSPKRFVGTTTFTDGSSSTLSAVSTGSQQSEIKTLTITPSPLHPDSPYTFSVAAQNTVNPLYGPSAVIAASTLPLIPPSLDSIVFNPVDFSARPVILRTDTLARQLLPVLINQGDITSSAFKSAIHTTGNRGSTDRSIASLQIGLKDGVASLATNTVTFNGFGGAAPASPKVAEGITINTRTGEFYAASPASWQGFYMYSENTITVPTSAVAQSYDLTVTATSDQVQTVRISKDSVVGPPLIASFAVDVAPVSGSTRLVSGIPVFYDTVTVPVVTTMTNMGNLFCASPLVTYTVSAGLTVNTSSEEKGALLGGAVTVRSKPLTASLTSVFTKSVSLTAVAHNLIMDSGEANLPAVPALIDGPSASLVMSAPVQPPILAKTPVSAVSGFRVWSSSSGGLVFNVPSLPLVQKSYDHSWDLTKNNGGFDATSELQIANGLICASGLGYGYQNYKERDYSSIANENGYRYATFVWAVPTGQATFTGLTFVVNGIQGEVDLITGRPRANTGDPILFFYRTEDSSSPAPIPNGLSSQWIDGFHLYVPQVNIYNYYVQPTTTLPSGPTTSIIYENNSIKTTVFIPPLMNIQNTVYIYGRIGLPMRSSLGFQNITAYLS